MKPKSNSVRAGGPRKLIEEYESESVVAAAPYAHLKEPCLLHPTTRDSTARRVFVLRHGPIKGGSAVFVCHHCDRNNCIEDSHAFLGSAQDNMRDAANKGRIVHSELQRARTAEANVSRTGWKMTEDGKKKISAANVGQNNPQYGKRWEAATCYGRTGDKHPMFGKAHSEETRRKISEGLKRKKGQVT